MGRRGGEGGTGGSGGGRRSTRGGIKGRGGGDGGTGGSGGGRVVWRRKEEGRSGGEEPQAANSIGPPQMTADSANSPTRAASPSGPPHSTAHDSQPQAASGQPQAANDVPLIYSDVTPRYVLLGRPDFVQRRCVWMNLLEVKTVFKTWCNVAVAIHNQPWREIEDIFEGELVYEVQFLVVVGVA